MDSVGESSISKIWSADLLETHFLATLDRRHSRTVTAVTIHTKTAGIAAEQKTERK